MCFFRADDENFLVPYGDVERYRSGIGFRATLSVTISSLGGVLAQ